MKAKHGENLGRQAKKAGVGMLGLIVGGSCVSLVANAGAERPAVARFGKPIEQVVHVGAPVEDLLPRAVGKSPATLAAPVEEIAMPRRTFALSFDAVFQLVQDQNGQVAVARAKVDEAVAAQAVVHKHFPPPDLHIRKCIEKKVEADVQVWKTKIDLAKVTSENLQDAAYTYVDLLAARTGEGIAGEIEQKLAQLLSQAKKLAEIDPGVKVEASRVEAEIAGQRQVSRKVKENQSASAAKLVYLLGLDANTGLYIGERQFMPLRLIDAQLPVEALVSQALVQGPGIYEFEGMIAVIDQAQARANGGHLAHFLGSSGRRQVRDARANQAYLSFQDLQAKLTMGVKEAREASVSCLEQIELGKANVKAAEETYNLADYRLKNSVKGRSPTEVLFSIRSLGEARLNYLQAVRDYNKAQIRLFIILGSTK